MTMNLDSYYSWSVVLESSLWFVISGVASRQDFGDPQKYSYLVADLRTSCHDGEYVNVIRPLALLNVLIYPVGVPLLYITILLKHRDQIKAAKGFGAEHIEFLFRPYSTKAWLFEPADVMRRLCCTGLLVFFDKGRLVVGTFLALFFFSLQKTMRPYANDDDNMVADIANHAITITLLTLVAAQAEAFSNGFAVVVCTVVNVVILPAAFLYSMRYATRRQMVLAALRGTNADPSTARRRSLVDVQHTGASPSGETSATASDILGSSGPGESEADFSGPSLFSKDDFHKMWSAGKRSRRELVMCSFEYVNRMLEVPVTTERWQKALFLLSLIDQSDSAKSSVMENETFGNLALGLRFTLNGETFFATLDAADSTSTIDPHIRMLRQVSKRKTPPIAVTVDETERTLTMAQTGDIVKYKVSTAVE